MEADMTRQEGEVASSGPQNDALLVLFGPALLEHQHPLLRNGL